MPTLKERFERAGHVIKGVAAFLALLPSIAVLIGLVAIPPSLADLMTFVSGAIGIIIILIVVLSSAAIRRMSNTMAVLLIAIGALGGAAASTQYFLFADRHIIYPPDNAQNPLILPTKPSAELQSLLEPYGEDYAEALATSTQRERIRELLKRESGKSLVIMLLLMVIGQSLVVGAIVIGAWKLAEQDERDQSAPPPRRGRRQRA